MHQQCLFHRQMITCTLQIKEPRMFVCLNSMDNYSSFFKYVSKKISFSLYNLSKSLKRMLIKFSSLKISIMNLYKSSFPYKVSKLISSIQNRSKSNNMSVLTNNRHALKSLSVLIEPQLAKQKDQEVMIFQAWSQKMDLTIAEENQLYQKVLRFIEEFLRNKALYTKMYEALNKRKSAKKVSSQKQNEKILSFKKMNMGSRICFDGEVASKQQKQERKQEGKIVRGNSKKISILIMEQDFSSSSEQFSDDFISENTIKTIRSIEIPQMEMNLSTISLIYDSPQPFLINLSLCLFIRYSFLTKRKVKFQESAWVLTVATIIAYKLYYDQEIEGLLDCFAGIMKIGKKDLIDLERCFFQEIDYNTVILNYDYHFVLSTLLSMQVELKI